jgi:hypothetical protein
MEKCETAKELSKDKKRTWTCPFCQQSVLIGAYGFCPSSEFRENCLLKEHIVADECIAYHDPDGARELMMERD